MTEPAVAAAGSRARRLYRSAAFQTTYVDGARAALSGKDRGGCPHSPTDSSSWKRAYRNAWLRGFDSIDQEDE